MNIRYAPDGRGASWVVAAGGRCVIVSGDTTAALIADLHAALSDGADLTRIVDAFTGAFGTSLHSLPPFAAVLPEGEGVRVAVRGALAVEVDAEAAAHAFSGAGVTTWSERVIDDAVRVRVRAGDREDAVYPLADGAAPASAVLLEREGTAVAQRPEPEIERPGPVEGQSPSATEAPQETLLPPETTVLPVQVPAAGDTATPGGGISAATTGYDDLWGVTVLRSVEDAAVRSADEPAPEAEASGTSDEAPGDHDGQTISVAQLRAMRGEAGPPAENSIPPLAPARPTAPGRLRVSNGQSVLLDRTVIVGRRPRSTRVAGTDLPHLVAVDSPQQDISRSHVEFRVEGDSILVTDLHTTNGTMLVRPGAAPTRLHPGEATVTVVGDVIDLGDGITVAVEAVS